jgi:hypothetical protein
VNKSTAVRNAYRDRAFLAHQMGASLPDLCVVCGVRQAGSGHGGQKRFAPPDFWWVLPPLTDFIHFMLPSVFARATRLISRLAGVVFRPSFSSFPFVRFASMRSLLCPVVHHNRS